MFIGSSSERMKTRKKLNKVCPVDNRPSTEQPNHFVLRRRKNIWFDTWHLTPHTWHVTPGTWYLTPDIWHITCETWWGVSILSKVKLSSSYVWVLWSFEGLEEKARIIYESIMEASQGQVQSNYVFRCLKIWLNYKWCKWGLLTMNTKKSVVDWFITNLFISWLGQRQGLLYKYWHCFLLRTIFLDTVQCLNG